MKANGCTWNQVWKEECDKSEEDGAQILVNICWRSDHVKIFPKTPSCFTFARLRCFATNSSIQLIVINITYLLWLVWNMQNNQSYLHNMSNLYQHAWKNPNDRRFGPLSVSSCHGLSFMSTPAPSAALRHAKPWLTARIVSTRFSWIALHFLHIL